MNSIKKIFLISITEYTKWIVNPRLLILSTVVIFIYNFSVKPLNEAALEMNTQLNVFEPYIAVVNSGAILLITPIAFMALISDFPNTDGNTFFLIIRTGRTKWFWGQVLFLIYAAITYIIVIAVSSIIPILDNAYFFNGWSLVVTDYYIEHSDNFVEKLVPQNLYIQMKPFLTAIHSTFLIFFQMLLIGSILLLFKAMGLKILGMPICGTVIATGITFCSINSKLMWFFPAANSIVWLHYTPYYREQILPIYYSYLYYFILLSTLFIVSFFKIRSYNYYTSEDIE